MRGTSMSMTSDFTEPLQLFESTNDAALGTVAGENPCVSSVGYVYQSDEKFGKFYLLLSDLAKHTQNLKAKPDVSLLITEPNLELPVHERKRATVLGKATLVKEKEIFSKLKEVYLLAFPKSEIFFTLADFRFYEIAPAEVHYYGGFGKAKVFK